MIRNITRAVMVLLATFVIPAAVLAGPLPASAAGPAELCETFGIYCLNTANFNLYVPVTESSVSGRNINAVLQSGTFEGHSLFLLQFNGDTSKCVAAADNNSGIVIHPCNGGYGTIWALKTSSGSDMWISRVVSKAYGSDIYLSGHECMGCQYGLYGLGVSGAFQKFKFS
jgi:hypothetical protein